MGRISGVVIVTVVLAVMLLFHREHSVAPPVSTFTVSTLALNKSQEQELIQLGLTPRDPVQITHANGKVQKLHGRFLHITDMHPDEFYKTDSSVAEACHHGKGKGKDRASKYGDAVLGCDSPLVLVEESLEWISKNLKDKIDFVIWTGDNIRHDNDRRYPRLETDIFDMNERIAAKVFETFKTDSEYEHDIKLVPSLGNNDVYPHNLFSPGPTLQTRELYKIWKEFIPSDQLHVFARGAYYFQEIIPNKLAVLSINTLYLFRSNPLVDNCDSKKEPGYKLFEWLGYTLKELRSRGMKVWLTGHVPPTPKNYDTTCLRKQVVWLHEYRDIIIGSLYGHMNIDHFIPLDSVKLYRSINRNLQAMGVPEDHLFQLPDMDNTPDIDDDNDIDFEDLELMNEHLDIIATDEIFGSEPHSMGGAPNGKVEYMNSIRDAFYSRMKGKKKSGLNSERYSVAHITASVVPTFNPGIRVWEYNITGLFDDSNEQEQHYVPWTEFLTDLDQKLFPEEEELMILDEELDYNTPFITKDQVVEILKKDKTFPSKMPPGTPLGPAYTPQTFTPERYVQYYVDLKKLNAQPDNVSLEYEIEYSTDDEFYELDTLMVEDWVQFARALGSPLKDKGKKSLLGQNKKATKLEKLWKLYLARSFVNTGYEDMDEYN